MQFNLELPLNSTSFGNISVSILRELYSRNLQPNLFCIGGPDLQTQNLTQDFANWIQSCINKAQRSFSRKNPTLSLWHLDGSQKRISDKQVCITFVETDSPTETELNIVKNLDKVIFTSSYTTETFQDYGATNVHTVPLGFDTVNFQRKEKSYFDDGRIRINIVGKFEKRKAHDKLIKIIADKWGNNPNYIFQFAIFNPFLKEQNQTIIAQLLEGKRYWNMQFFGFMPRNSQFNDFLNSGDAVLAMSNSESWGLPEFHSVAMGKHALVHNVNGYKEWADSENSVLVEPSGKQPVYDGMFFAQGSPFNQGNFFSWDANDFVEGFEKLVSRIKNNKLNEKGLELQSKFTYKKTVDELLAHLES